MARLWPYARNVRTAPGFHCESRSPRENTRFSRSALSLNAQAVESSYLCRPLLEYFRDCRRRNPRWKLCDPLHITLLRQQKGEPAALATAGLQAPFSSRRGEQAALLKVRLPLAIE